MYILFINLSTVVVLLITYIYMKFTLPTDVLKNVTGTMTKVITKDVSGSKAGGIVVTVSSDTVFFTMQQFDFGVAYSYAATDTADGTVSVSASVLDGIVSSLIDSFVTVELKDKTIVVSTGTSTSTMHILADDEDDGAGDMSAPKPDEKPSFLIKREVLLRGFKSVQHAAADSFIKPEIASVYLYTKDDSVYFVATDAFRLSEMRFLSDGVSNDVSILLPIRSVAKLIRVLEGVSDADVSLFIRDEGICIAVSSVSVKMNSVSGSFPDYKGIMPSEFAVEIVVLRSDIVNFLRKARLFADRLNKLTITIAGEKTVTLAFSNETVGSTADTVPAVITGTVDSLPSFNYKFVSDALSVISDDRVMFSATDDSTKPLMIRGADDTALTAIISPLLDRQD